MENYVITVARGFGSGGKEIAMKLSERLEIPCFDRQILTMASEQSGIDESLFVDMDEKVRGNYITNFLRRYPYTYVAEPAEKDFVSDINLYNIQADIIRELAGTQSCIIIGKCADYLLRDRRNVISVYIEAPRQACIRSICKKLFVSEEKAVQMIKKTDKYRANYYNYYTGGGIWTNPVNYDMTLNSDRIGRDKCVDVIEDFIGIKFAEEADK